MREASGAAHAKAREFTAEYDGQIMTIVWVITEFADALAGRKNRATFARVDRQFRADPDIA